ncbi:MAG: archaetidylserine decarboxylase [Gammaproteobacteria bacterium]
MSQSPRTLLQYLLPQHGISRLVHRLMRSQRMPAHKAFARWFVRRYGVDMSEALEPRIEAYPDFNSLFTRALRPGTRPTCEEPGGICCPVDGYLSQAGAILDTEIFQAKGRRYSLVQLLGGSAERAAPFVDGNFATLYLSPGDYHRVHMPMAGRLTEMVHVPGKLFSVSPACVRAIPGLFARNERVVSIFETGEAGPMAMVLVGAINVGSIETVWAGEVTPPRGRRIASHRYPAQGDQSVHLGRGEEMGRFNLGSTVILLFGPNRVRWEPGLEPERPLRLGQCLGRLRG